MSTITFSTPFASPKHFDKEDNDGANAPRIKGDWTSPNNERSFDISSKKFFDQDQNARPRVRIEGDWIDMGRVPSYCEDDRRDYFLEGSGSDPEDDRRDYFSEDSGSDPFSVEGSDLLSEGSDPYQQLLTKIWVNSEQDGMDAVETESRDDVLKIKDVLLTKSWVDVEQEGWGDVGTEGRDDVDKGNVEIEGRSRDGVDKFYVETKGRHDVDENTEMKGNRDGCSVATDVGNIVESKSDESKRKMRARLERMIERVVTGRRGDVQKGESEDRDDAHNNKDMEDNRDGCSVATEVGNSMGSKSDESMRKRRARLERMIEMVIMSKPSSEVGDAAQKNADNVVIELHLSRSLEEQSGHRQTATSERIMATPTTKKAFARRSAIIRGSTHFIQRWGKNEHGEKVDDGNEENQNGEVPTRTDNATAKPLVAFIGGANIIMRIAKAQIYKNITNSSIDINDGKTSPCDNKENEAPAMPTRTSAGTNRSAGVIALANKMRTKGNFKMRAKPKKRITYTATANDDATNDENAERTFRMVADAAMAAAMATESEGARDAATAAVGKRTVISRSRDTNPSTKSPRRSQKIYRSNAHFHKEAAAALAAAEAAEVKKRHTISVLDVQGSPKTCDNGEGAKSCAENPTLENDAACSLSRKTNSFEFDAVVTASSDEDDGFIGTANQPEDDVEEEIHVDACPAAEPSTTKAPSAAPPCDPRKLNYVHLLMPYLVNYGGPTMLYPPPPPPPPPMQQHYFGGAAMPQNSSNYYYVTIP